MARSSQTSLVSARAVGKAVLLAAILVAVVAVATPAYAQKTDVVTLHNGDKVTGEIKGVEQGKMQLSTDALGTVDVKWEHIASIQTDKTLEVEMSSGVRYYGSVEPSAEPGRIDVVQAVGRQSVVEREIVSVQPARSSFWARFNGNVDLGFNLTQASDQIEYDLNLSNTYDGRKSRIFMNLSSTLKLVEGDTTTNRQAFDLAWLRALRWPRWFAIGLGSLQHNQELDLAYRANVGGGVGRYLLESSRYRWAVYGAGLVTQEEFFDDPSDTNFEAAAGTTADVYVYGDHDLTFKTSFQAIPSITDAGRVRLAFRSGVSYELIHNLYLGLNFYDDYDTRPPQEGAKKSDLGLSSSVGYKW